MKCREYRAQILGFARDQVSCSDSPLMRFRRLKSVGRDLTAAQTGYRYSDPLGIHIPLVYR
jgi:hypothetical protein